MILAIAAMLASALVDPPVVPINLSSYAFAPEPISLKEGQEVRLVLTNTSGKSHDFAAPDFFAAARVAPQSLRFVRSGRVEVPAGEQVTIQLMPARGQFALKCTHFAHAMLGMKGVIVVQ